MSVDHDLLETYKCKTLGETSVKHGLAPVTTDIFNTDHIDTVFKIEHVNHDTSQTFDADRQGEELVYKPLSCRHDSSKTFRAGSHTAYFGTINRRKIVADGPVSFEGHIHAKRIRGDGDLTVKGAYSHGSQDITTTSGHLRLANIHARNGQTLGSRAERLTVDGPITTLDGDQEIGYRTRDITFNGTAISRGKDSKQLIGEGADYLEFNGAAINTGPHGFQHIGFAAEKFRFDGTVINFGDSFQNIAFDSDDAVFRGVALANGKQDIGGLANTLSVKGTVNPDERRDIGPAKDSLEKEIETYDIPDSDISAADYHLLGENSEPTIYL